MNQRAGLLQIWWNALVSPEQAGRLVTGETRTAGLDQFVTGSVAALYAVYGVSMGLFHSPKAAAISSAKLPFLFLLTLAVCFPPLYALNCLFGPRLRARQCLRMLLLALSANAAALGSYAPVSLFFTLTAFEKNYTFLVLMHVVVFALAGAASLAVITLIFRATADHLGKRLRPSFLAAWGLIYAVVGCQMAWTLRPWIGFHGIPYTWFRTREGNFFEAVWHIVRQYL